MDQATAVMRLRLGGDVYLWQAGHLQDGRGRDVPLRAKSLRMFEALLAGRGTVLSKDQLSALVWPDTVATDESIARCISDIRKALHDTGQSIVETFPKQGYRLNAEVIADAPRRVGRRPLIAVILVLAALGAALTLQRGAYRSEPPVDLAIAPAPAVRDSVAILPFEAATPEDRFLADGLAEDLEMHLADISGLRVQTRLAPSGDEEAAALARSLGLRYVVEGRVRRSGEQVAISLRLIDGADGAMLWADRYEGARAGMLAFRDELPDALVAAMAVELSKRDRQRLAIRDTTDPEAFEDVMRARRDLSTFTYEGTLSAEKHLRRAIARDPGYARAHAELASTFVIRMENDWIVLSSADTAKAFHFAETALELDPDLWFGHYILGRLHSVADTGDIDTALAHLRVAMDLQPANDDARAYFAIVVLMSGAPEQASRIFESTLATHPEPPFWYILGWANTLFHLGRHEEALEAVARCLSQMPNSPYCLRSQIAILARLGRIEDAQWAIEEYAILGHDLSLDAIMKGSIERDPSMRAYLRDSYALLGLQ